MKLQYPCLAFSCLLSIAFTASSASAQETTTAGGSVFLKPVELSDKTQENLTSITLDQDIYAGSTDSFNDLRLLNSSGKEVPFVLHRRLTEERKTHRIPTPITQPHARPLENDGLEITFTIDREKHSHSIDGLTFSTRLRDFEHRVTVESRAKEEESWKTLASNALIYDYSRYMDVRSLEVPFSQKSSQTEETEFRVRIEKVTQEKESQFRELTRTMKNGEDNETQEKFNINREILRIDGISFWHETETVVSTLPVLTNYPIQLESRREDEKSKTTVVEFTSHREPLTQINITTEDKNFHREVTLYALAADKTLGTSTESERLLTQSSITQLSLPNAQRSDLLIHFTPTRASRFRLVIHNGDSPPLKEGALAAHGETYELLFFSEPGQSYSVLYGNPLLDTPKYDTLAIKTAIDTKVQAVPATLGKPTPHTLDDPRSEWAKIFENRLLVGAVFAALILVLGFTLYQAGKRLSSIPQS